MNLTKKRKKLCTFIRYINENSIAEKCSHVVNIVYNCSVIMYCFNLICYLYAIVLTKVTRNKDI